MITVKFTHLTLGHSFTFRFDPPWKRYDSIALASYAANKVLDPNQPMNDYLIEIS